MIDTYTAALLLTVVTSFGLAVFLFRHADPVPGGVPLTLFVSGVGLYSSGPLSLAALGPDAADLALALYGFVAVPAALYLHFAVRFAGEAACPWPRAAIWAGYLTAGVATIACFSLGVGTTAPWRGFDAAFLPGLGGWVGTLIAIAVAVAAHIQLLATLVAGPAVRRRQTAIVFTASAVGLLACSGFLFPALTIEFDPWPVVLLPAFSFTLAFGILRYRLMAINVWARRTITWLGLVLCIGIGIAGLGSVAVALGVADRSAFSTPRIWFALTLVLALALALAAPLRRLSDRLIFPGALVDDAKAVAWRRDLGAAASWGELGETASRLISAHFKDSIRVMVSPSPMFSTFGPGNAPAAACGPDLNGVWQARLINWEDAPPGARQAALVFIGILREVAANLDRSIRFAAEADARRQQAHFAELGQLAATVAHDLRNPLNTIAMATAGTDPDTRHEVRDQLDRMNALIADLLDYSTAWKVQPAPSDLRDLIETAAVGMANLDLSVEVPDGLVINVDAHRLRRVFANLLANAVAAADGEPARASVQAAPDGWGSIVATICDAGRGIPPDLRETLFQPFVSGRTGGTGLGLAIVARVVDAHGGNVAVVQAPTGWTTAIQLRLPIDRPSSTGSTGNRGG